MDRPLHLSDTERRILAALATHGFTNRQLAAHLGIKERTVVKHLAHIYTKLRVENRAEAVAWAWQSGWLTSEGRGLTTLDLRRVSKSLRSVLRPF